MVCRFRVTLYGLGLEFNFCLSFYRDSMEVFNMFFTQLTCGETIFGFGEQRILRMGACRASQQFLVCWCVDCGARSA